MTSPNSIQLTLPLADKETPTQDTKGGQVYRGERHTVQLRERLHHSGVQGLSNHDLLTLVLCTGKGHRHVVEQIHTLLENNSLQELLKADVSAVYQEYGLSAVKAAQLQAVLELARRLSIPSGQERYQIISPKDAANLVMAEMTYLDHEEMRVLVLDTKHQVVANLRLYQGTVNSTVLRASEIFKPAITRNCPNILICHNHPSGDPIPSEEDIAVTRQLVEAAKLLDLELVDHLIIANHRFTSLKERIGW